MATPMATKRLKQDYIRLQRDPVPFIEAAPLPSNLLEWHYVVRGPDETPYHGGYYHGKLVFPKEYPFKPPKIIMITPNGRFQTNTRLCLSISDFHPDTWNPAWSVSTILTGLLSFMVEDTITLGSIETSNEHKKSLAIASWDFNLRDRYVCQLFPDTYEEIKKKQEEHRKTRTKKVKNPYIVHSPGQSGHQGYCSGVIANLLLVIAVIMFAAMAKLLLQGTV